MRSISQHFGGDFTSPSGREDDLQFDNDSQFAKDNYQFGEEKTGFVEGMRTRPCRAPRGNDLSVCSLFRPYFERLLQFLELRPGLSVLDKRRNEIGQLPRCL